MAKEIFDQERPRSTMAQRLDEAFAGCEEWTVVAAPPRRARPLARDHDESPLPRHPDVDAEQRFAA